MSKDVIDYASLKDDAKSAPKEMLQLFKRAGAEISNSWVGKQKRASGITFRELFFVFADSQEISLRVKQTGDVYQVVMNGKVMPITNQDDVTLAVAEIVKAVEANSNRFQLALTKKKVKMPTGIKTTIKKKEVALQERIEELDALITDAKEVLANGAA